MAVVTFDFDNTLTRTEAKYDEAGRFTHSEYIGGNGPVIEALKASHASGDDIVVITSRSPSDSANVVKALDSLGVLGLISGLHCTAGVPKGEYMADRGISSTRHFDDDPAEAGYMPDCVEFVTVPVHASWDKHNETGPRSAPARMAAMMGAA